MKYIDGNLEAEVNPMGDMPDSILRDLLGVHNNSDSDSDDSSASDSNDSSTSESASSDSESDHSSSSESDA